MNAVIQKMLDVIAGLSGEKPAGAYNIRVDGKSESRASTEHIQIISKEDNPGIDIRVAPGTKGEFVHIPVVVEQSGLVDLVYNDFYIGEDSDVQIIAGCGIHNDGCDASQHDGIHRFHLCPGARLKYVEKHYGEGEGTGDRILNPTTIVQMEEGSYCEMEMVQIEGVTSTVRKTDAHLGKDAKLVVTEKLMTHGKQTAHSDMTVNLDGEDAALQIISRSVAKDTSVQVFHPIAVGNTKSRAHVQCDSIIMDDARVSSIPEITANHALAQIVHEAAIGRINNEQLLKLQTLGLTEEGAETVIVNAFLD